MSIQPEKKKLFEVLVRRPTVSKTGNPIRIAHELGSAQAYDVFAQKGKSLQGSTQR